MRNAYVDLHIHSSLSDGTFLPERIVALSHKLGLAAISITDHDTVAGIERASAPARAFGVELIPGVELSAAVGDRDIHLLGYYFDPADSRLLRHLARFRDERFLRAERMVKKLNTIGLSLTIDKVIAQAGGGAVGRPHVADALVSAGFVSSTGEAFSRYIGYNGPAYESKFAVTPQAAIDLIRGAGGMAVLAHPGTYESEPYLADLVASGLRGIEVIYPKHTEEQQTQFELFADAHGLAKTGGSDCHGYRHGEARIGSMQVPVSYLEGMKKAMAVFDPAAKKVVGNT